MSATRNLAGRTFGYLVVLGRTTGRINGNVVWTCRCSCGSVLEVSTNSLTTGNTKSCGCFRKESSASQGRRNTRHGHAKNGVVTPEYYTWSAMLARCSNPNNDSFPDYGGRGIRVCECWLSFKNFIADMGPRPPGTSLDRIDNDKNYEKANCQWANKQQQRRNQRRNQKCVCPTCGTLVLKTKLTGVVL